VAIALAVIGTPQSETVGRARALDLFFASHVPWSLWLLAAAAWVPSPLGRPAMPLSLAAVAAIALTPRIIAAFFREVLKMDRRHTQSSAIGMAPRRSSARQCAAALLDLLHRMRVAESKSATRRIPLRESTPPRGIGPNRGDG
jgi:hypothetical protein